MHNVGTSNENHYLMTIKTHTSTPQYTHTSSCFDVPGFNSRISVNEPGLTSGQSDNSSKSSVTLPVNKRTAETARKHDLFIGQVRSKDGLWCYKNRTKWRLLADELIESDLVDGRARDLPVAGSYSTLYSTRIRCCHERSSSMTRCSRLHCAPNFSFSSTPSSEKTCTRISSGSFISGN